jgi:diaminopropionate ammonia-lyase family
MTTTCFLNPRAQRGAYPEELAAVLSPAQGARYAAWLVGWPRVPNTSTPLVSLTAQAERLGLGALLLKDEGRRSMLGSFKALGAPVALVAEVLRRHPTWDGPSVLAGRYAEALAGFTVISATDGNHGRSLAAAAQDAGCRCVIVLHAEVSEEREAAIAALGARVVRVSGNYDASVAEAARIAEAEGWQVISDTSYAGYEQIPGDVMQGYSRIAAEALAQAPAGFSHVVLQGGVGGLAAGVVSEFWGRQDADRPTVLVVEPVQADCLLQSAREGRAASATGSVDSVMAGLACGEASPLAWRFLESSVDAFLTIEDDAAIAAMRRLAEGSDREPPLVVGECGAAGLAALEGLRAVDRAALGLDETASVLLINTEGATAPAVYAALVGERAEAVAARRDAWHPPFSNPRSAS